MSLAGTMVEVSPSVPLCLPSVLRQGRRAEQIVPPQPPDPIMGGPQCRSRREARTLRL